eukprot:TRINITY_DN110540_c0_g1_i1.p4 TRINITY_DN110540_c0_g1~~TRINITY_DN110540_c0_g1_i1.p4  ORF type:complete len:132 (+),score=3.31 TRINITY_DN110540_c0_g1_i1:3-398(+)
MVQQEIDRIGMKAPEINFVAYKTCYSLPPKIAVARCVYIVFCENEEPLRGYVGVDCGGRKCSMYVGQSCSIEERLRQHSRKYQVHLVVVFSITRGTIDMLKTIEVALLRHFDKQNYQLLTVKDMKNNISNI